MAPVSALPTVRSRLMSALNAVTAAYHVSHWPGWVCAYTREEGALAVALAPPGVPRPVDVPVIFLRGPNREQIRYSLGAGTRGSDSRVGLTWTSGVGLRRTSCDSNLSLRQHGPVPPAEVQAVCSRLNLPVLRDLQALVKGFHPNTAADSSRQVCKKPPRSKSGTNQLQKTLRKNMARECSRR